MRFCQVKFDRGIVHSIKFDSVEGGGAIIQGITNMKGSA